MLIFSSTSQIKKVSSRFIFLTKRLKSTKFFTKRQTQRLVFLRAPKHFNIGKQQIYSSNSKGLAVLTHFSVYRISTGFIFEDTALYSLFKHLFFTSHVIVVNTLLFEIKLFCKFKFSDE